MSTIKSINPTTNETLKEYPEIPVSETCAIIEKAHQDFLEWKKTSFAHRASCFKKLAELLRLNKKQCANTIALEMGKPITQGLAEIQKSAWVCEYYADNAEHFLQDQSIKTDSTQSFITHQPIGLILAIMPWNFPFWQVLRAAAPALMAGNGMLLKHSSNVPDCALTIEALFHQAGFPTNIFRTLLVSSKNTAIALVNPHIQGITLTGSTEAGKMIAAQAGSQIKKCVLELGGSDPYIVLQDADLDLAAQACATSRMINAGQSCIAAKRFIVASEIYDAFKNKLLEHLKIYTCDDPLKESTLLGPMARINLRDELHQQVQKSIDLGAQCLLGGSIPESPGAFYPTTLLANVQPGMPAYHEELFGPVAALIPAKNESEALTIANDSPFGLGAALFTQDIEKGHRLAREEIHAGSCFVNDFVKSDPRLPFGGIKQSGFGRELGPHGITEFTNIKTIVIQ